MWFFGAIGSFFGGVALLSAAEGLLSLNISLSLVAALEHYRGAIRACFFWFPIIFEALPPQWYMDLFAISLLLSHCLVKTAIDHPRGSSAVGSTFRFSTLPASWDWRIVYLTVPYLVNIPYLLITPAMLARRYHLERMENISERQKKEEFRSQARERGVEFYDQWLSDMAFERTRISTWIDEGTKTIRSFLRFYVYVTLAVAAALLTYLIDALALNIGSGH